MYIHIHQQFSLKMYNIFFSKTQKLIDTKEKSILRNE